MQNLISFLSSLHWASLYSSFTNTSQHVFKMKISERAWDKQLFSGSEIWHILDDSREIRTQRFALVVQCHKILAKDNNLKS